MKLYQFSLRAAILVFTLAGVGLGLYGRHWAEQRRQRRLVDEATRLCELAGCWPFVTADSAGHFNIALDAGDGSPTGEAMRAVVDARLIRRVHFIGLPAHEPQEALADGFSCSMHSSLGSTWDRNAP